MKLYKKHIGQLAGKLLLLAVALAFAVTCPAKSPESSTVSYTAPVRDYIVTGEGRFAKVTGLALALYHLNEPAGSNNPEQAAKIFLLENAGRFGGPVTVQELRTVAVKHSPGGTHVHLQQETGGIPVYGAWFSISINRQNRISMVLANPYPGMTLPGTVPVISAGDVVSLTRDLLRGTGPELNEPFTRLVAFRDDNGIDHLAYTVRLVSMNPMGDWEVIWDAIDGKHLVTLNHIRNEDGTGLVFDPDPLTTAEVEYGVPYIDNEDEDCDELNNQRVSVTLNDIEFIEGFWRLEGPYVRIVDFKPPEIEPVVCDELDGFNFTRSQSGFEDVNVYYHIDNAQRHLQYLGFEDIQDEPIEADSHGLNGDDNSHYIPWTNQVAFGDGGVDDAEDADVIYHEYGHAIQADQIPNFDGGHTGAMGEGFCDYWAGTFSARISDYHDNWFANWDGHNPFWGGRILDYWGVYPDQWTGNIYNDGQIWSSCLWNIRSQVGADVADAIIVQSHYYLSFGATVEDGAEALLQADLDLFGGANQFVIALACYEKGFIDDVPGSSAIEGTVLDIGDETPVEGAVVSLDDDPVLTTGPDGTFLIESLDSRTYELSVSAVEYARWSDSIEVGVNETVTVMVYLEQPTPVLNTDELDLMVSIGSVLDTAITISNTGNGEVEWSIHFRQEGVEIPQPWTLQNQVDVGNVTGDWNVFGVTVMDDLLVVSGCNNDDQPNLFYILNSAGNLLAQVNQPSVTESGYRDLATDGNLLYCSEGEWIVGIDLSGIIHDSIPGPLNLNRAITYDPENDWFWCADNASDIVAIDREGTIQIELASSIEIQGLGWFPYDPEGMMLYASSREGVPGDYFGRIWNINPETGTTGILHDFALDESYNFAAGCDVSASLSGLEQYWVCPLLSINPIQQTSRLELYLIDTSVHFASADPVQGTIPVEDQQRVALRFDATTLELWEYIFEIDIIHNGYYSPLTIPVSLVVHFVGRVEPVLQPAHFSVKPAGPNPFNAVTGWNVHLPAGGAVRMTVFDILGREVDRDQHVFNAAGTHRVEWKAPKSLATGIYFVSFKAGDSYPGTVHKVLLLK